MNISDVTIEEAIAAERAESLRHDKTYRGDASPSALEGKVAILVDDGITTASSMRAAISILRLRRPARMVIAVPVASRSSVLELRAQVEEVVTCSTPNGFETVSQWYDDFEPSKNWCGTCMSEQEAIQLNL